MKHVQKGLHRGRGGGGGGGAIAPYHFPLLFYGVVFS